MINYKEMADKYNYDEWKVDIINYIKPMLKEPWHIYYDFITNDMGVYGYSLRIAYDQRLSREDVRNELCLFGILDWKQIYNI